MDKRLVDGLAFIDYLNKNPNKSLEELASSLGISRATLYRRLSLLRKKGLVKKYGIKTWCIGLGVSIWFLIPLDVGIGNDIVMSNEVLRGTLESIYVTYSPSRTIIVKHFFRSEEEHAMISKAYTKYLRDYYEPIENISTCYIITPRLYYGEKKVCIDVKDYNCPRSGFDNIDTIIVDGFLRGITAINEISSRYHIPESTIRYHYREHVKRIIYTTIYVLHRRINIISEIVTRSIEYLVKTLNLLYADNVIDYIDNIYLVNSSNPVIAYVEMHGDIISLFKSLEDMLNIGLIDDVKIYGVYERSRLGARW